MRKLRPTAWKLSKTELKKVNDDIGLHPSRGRLTARNCSKTNRCASSRGSDIPIPTSPTFAPWTSWQAGSAWTRRSPKAGSGARRRRRCPAGSQSFHLKSANQSSLLALRGCGSHARAVDRVAGGVPVADDCHASWRGQRRSRRKGHHRARRKEARAKKPGLLDFVSRTAATTYDSSKRLQEIGKNYQPKTPYPNTPLANRLKLAAQLIDAELGARIFYVSINGFDTHSTQAPAHANLLTQVSGAMTAFYKDMKARGHGDRVLMMTFSEFGRRAKENGSRGTDHGSGAPMFLIGSKIKAGVVGAHPSLTDVPMGSLKHHTDFRQVYAAILDKWLGVSSKDVLGKEFKAADVL